MGITISRPDIKAYSYSFSPIIEAQFETSVSLLKTVTEIKFSLKG